MKVTLDSCLVACQLSLIHSGLALPLATRSATKGLLLWDYTNTQAATTNTNVKTALDTAAGNILAVSNWNTWRPKEASADLAFWPQVRTMAQLSGDEWTFLITSIETEVAAGRTPVVQYLNEPEYLGVSAADAAGAWRSSMLPLRTTYGAKLVGVATSSSADGIAYQHAFMGALGDGEKPDFVGAHYYTTDGQAVADEVAWGQSYLGETHAKYGLPLVVSEVASTSRDAAQVSEFSDTFKGWMEAQDWIASYGFFGATLAPANDWVSPVAQLLDTAGTWTDLGKDVIGL